LDYITQVKHGKTQTPIDKIKKKSCMWIFKASSVQEVVYIHTYSHFYTQTSSVLTISGVCEAGAGW